MINTACHYYYYIQNHVLKCTKTLMFLSIVYGIILQPVILVYHRKNRIQLAKDITTVKLLLLSL